MEWLGAAVLLAVAVGAAIQVVAGTGFALVCAPFLLLMLGHDLGVRVVLLLSIVLNVVVLAFTLRHARVKDAARLLIPAAIVVVPTVFVVDAIRGPALTISAGVVIVVGTMLVARGRAMRMIDGTGGVVLVGAVSGMFTVLAGVGGPPVTLLAVQRRWAPDVSRATMQAFFLPLNILALTMLGPLPADFSDAWWAVGGCVLGVLGGTLAARRVSARIVRRAMLVVAACGGFWLIASGTWETVREIIHRT